MIKKIMKIYWSLDQSKKSAISQLISSIRRRGFLGTKRAIDEKYKILESDFITNRSLNRRYSRLVSRVLFLTMFILTSTYYLAFKSELFESKSAVIVKDMSSPTASSGLELSLLGMGGSSQLQDSKVVEEYLLSLDFFISLDEKFSLIKHFKSNKIDFLERLSSDATLEDALEFYQARTNIEYDEVSGILHVAYSHTNAKQAKMILDFMIKEVENQLNELNKIKALKQLDFIQVEFEKQKQKMERAYSELESYQNKNKTLDPNTKAVSDSSIIAMLEQSLTEKNIELSTLRGYLNENNYEIIKVKSEIQSIKKSITEKKSGLSGVEENGLNRSLVDFEKLKMALEFETEIYKNALIQLETTRLEVSKAAKTLTIISKPNLPDGYSYPDKPKAFFTIVMVYFLMYGIFTMLAAIIRDHKE